MKNPGNRLFLILAAFVAALGGLLFGFDTAVISGTIPFIQPYFALSDVGLGWTVSSLLVGCIVGVAGAGVPGDAFGRRKVLIASALIFLLSRSLLHWQKASWSLWLFGLSAALQWAWHP